MIQPLHIKSITSFIRFFFSFFQAVGYKPIFFQTPRFLLIFLHVGGVNLNINMQSKANHTYIRIYTLGGKKEKEKKINPKRKFQDSKGERLRAFFDCFDKKNLKKIWPRGKRGGKKRMCIAHRPALAVPSEQKRGGEKGNDWQGRLRNKWHLNVLAVRDCPSLPTVSFRHTTFLLLIPFYPASEHRC